MRAFEKLSVGDSLTIGYLGGSITYGVGATQPDRTSWRARTTRWFRERFPESTVCEINAALNGTGSDLAAFRVGDDLLRHKPDLIFVEFAVNDHRLPAAAIVRATEGLVRRIQRESPQTDIVFVLATMRSLAERHAVPPPVHAHRQVARHYRLEEIDAGRAFLNAMAGSCESWESLTTDGCHPTDRGHAVYGRAVREFLERNVGRKVCARSFLPKPLSLHPLERGRVLAVHQDPPPGWRWEDENVGRFLRGRLVSDSPGSEIRFAFNGTAVGLYWLVSEDSGAIDWSIDDSPPERKECWDEYATRFARPHYCVFSDSLCPGTHELRIRVSRDRPSRSSGRSIRIGAFLVNETSGLP